MTFALTTTRDRKKQKMQQKLRKSRASGGEQIRTISMRILDRKALLWPEISKG